MNKDIVCAHSSAAFFMSTRRNVQTSNRSKSFRFQFELVERFLPQLMKQKEHKIQTSKFRDSNKHRPIQIGNTRPESAFEKTKDTSADTARIVQKAGHFSKRKHFFGGGELMFEI